MTAIRDCDPNKREYDVMFDSRLLADESINDMTSIKIPGHVKFATVLDCFALNNECIRSKISCNGGFTIFRDRVCKEL